MAGLRWILLVTMVLVAADASDRAHVVVEPTRPLANHHQHLVSPAAMKLLDRPLSQAATTADQLIAQMDEAGIQRGVVLSTAYWFGSPRMRRAPGDEQANVQAENDWTARESARFTGRLVAFCSFNPLAD
jgi:uncharacterized protein